jgi:hypothetical protein
VVGWGGGGERGQEGGGGGRYGGEVSGNVWGKAVRYVWGVGGR